MIIIIANFNIIQSMIIFQVLTYIQSPYKYVNNTDATTSSTVKVVITDKKGKQLKLRDLDDPVDMAVDMTKVNIEIHFYGCSYMSTFLYLFFGKNIVKTNKGNFIVTVIICHG